MLHQNTGRFQQARPTIWSSMEPLPLMGAKENRGIGSWLTMHFA